jgi:hypothetical protein
VERRWGVLHQTVKHLLQEVTKKTGVSVTSFLAYKDVGALRTPQEVYLKKNHPFNQGYGVIAHSGYHVIDQIAWLLQASFDVGKKPDSFHLCSEFDFPCDYFTQVSPEDLGKAYRDFQNNHKPIDLNGLGEINSHTHITFFMANRVLARGSFQIGSGGVSQRDSLAYNQHELASIYEHDPGKTKLESYLFCQGPFQTIEVNICQNRANEEKQGKYSPGGKHHAEIRITRNKHVFPECFATRVIQAKHLEVNEERLSVTAMRRAIYEFLDRVSGGNIPPNPVSDIESHELGIAIMSAIYESASQGEKRIYCKYM